MKPERFKASVLHFSYQPCSSITFLHSLLLLSKVHLCTAYVKHFIIGPYLNTCYLFVTTNKPVKGVDKNVSFQLKVFQEAQTS